MDHPLNGLPRQRDVMRRFEQAAADYNEHDFLPRHTAAGLLERVAPVELDARRILNLGAATGSFSRDLQKRYKRSRVLNLDLSPGMLRIARRRRSWFSRGAEIQASAEAIPLADDSVDAVFANLLLPWLADPRAMLAEVARVLRNGGLFAFAALGPDSLGGLRAASDDDPTRVRRFEDMHDIGDAILGAGLRDPVLDVDHLQIDYRDSDALFRDLSASGARNSLHGRRNALTGRRANARRQALLAEQFVDGVLTVNLELVYGHAFGATLNAANGEYRFDVADLQKRRR